MVFHDSNQIFFSQKAEFKCLDDSEVVSSDFPGLKTSAASMTSVKSTASMTSTASFYHKRITHPDGLIIPGTKMTNSISVEWIIKNHSFY